MREIIKKENNHGCKKTKTYDIKKLPLPIHPGDAVFFVLEDGDIEEDVAAAVGINEEGVIMIVCDDGEYEVGTED